ncbi:MAG: hypothetical protein NWR72_16935, partial [Bacteroidia bacterium]|nr:hypothetical protein [Bacteroidia bacterium]
SYNVTSPLAPGDSIKLPSFSHHFNEARFTGGGGLTYDIIVWPMSVGPGQSDSLYQPVSYLHTQASASRLHISSPPAGFPGEVIVGNSYDLVFRITNTDTVLSLYQPITILMAGNGISSSDLLINQKLKSPVLPGDSVSFTIPAHTFDVTTGGGGLTYDIIVWPMSIGANDVDTLHRPIKIYNGAAIELTSDPVAPIADPTNGSQAYEVTLVLGNAGHIASSDPIDVFVQIDDQTPVLFYTSFNPLEGGDTTSIQFQDFRLSEMISPALPIGQYTLRLFAQERNTSNWYKDEKVTLTISEEALETELITVSEGGVVAVSWALPWDITDNEYGITRQQGVAPRETIAVTPGFDSPEIPVEHKVYDLAPLVGSSEYRLVKKDLRTNVRMVVARKEVTMNREQFLQQGVLSGLSSSSTRLISLNLDEGADALIIWYDVAGRELGRSSAYLAAGSPNWQVPVPQGATGVVYWTLRVGGQIWSGHTARTNSN